MPRPRKVNPTDYKNQFQREKYDRIAVQVKKGKRDVIKAYADDKGMTVNEYIKKLISDDMGGLDL